MITYTYIVKCPECEDEFFDFFEEAKEFALGCMSKKPIITQTEVDRNDFGECTDHCDLGTVWSWEDALGKETDAEPTISVFTKDDLTRMTNGEDPEFAAIDNSVDYEPETETLEVSNTMEASDDFRKPIPEGMTIEQLVEEMEENEDAVECTLCQDLFDKSECRKELNLGWLCRRCADDLTARGEGPVFKEDNYWDFLDEEVDTKKRTWVCYYNGNDLGTVEADTEEEAYLKMEQTWPEYNYNNEDVQVIPEDELDEELDPEAVHDLGNEYDGGYPAEKPELPETDEISDSQLTLCPECGKNTFDAETGICVGCGFN